MLKSDHEIICIAHSNYLTSTTFLTSILYPQIEDIVEIDF